MTEQIPVRAFSYSSVSFQEQIIVSIPYVLKNRHNYSWKEESNWLRICTDCTRISAQLKLEIDDCITYYCSL
jgi:hypothetical protein